MQEIDDRVRRSVSTFFLAMSLILSGCAATASVSPAPVGSEQVIADRLFFGRNIPAGGTVSDEELQTFLREVVTPRFPKGFTMWEDRGQWLDPRGTLVREQGFVIEVLHEKSATVDADVAAIAAEYKKRFGQDAVLRVTEAASMQFY